MAIQVDLENSHFGIPFNGAYFRIATVAISRTRDPNNKFSVMIDVAGYAAVPELDTKEIDFRRYHASYSTIEAQEGDNILAKCYAWVMAQPDMNGSIGV
jgi:hypothetical protein